MYSKIQYISQGETHEEQIHNITEVLKAGYTWIQLRYKNKPEAEYMALAKEVRKLCNLYNACLIINDAVTVALESKADGLHVGLTDISVAAARVILGDDKIIGGTANTMEDVLQRVTEGCNYIGLGPYAYTTTKENLSPILGAEGYSKILKSLQNHVQLVPVYAIGGITAENINDVAKAGVYGVALSGEITKSSRKRELRIALQNAISGAAAPIHFSGAKKEEKNEDVFRVGNYIFNSRLLMGTGKFGSLALMRAAIEASGCEIATVALKRVNIKQQPDDDMLLQLNIPGLQLMPNTSGARNAKEAVFAAQLAREALETDLIKLEIHPDPKYLLPDPIETLRATEELAKLGFTVMPYIHADPVLCKLLENAGTAAVMPLGAPIGSNMGLRTADFLKIIIEQSTVPVVVDAGIGAPSDAAMAMEMGADAVLVNTAISVANNPALMAEAFKQAVAAGRQACLAGLGQKAVVANASSPLTSFLS